MQVIIYLDSKEGQLMQVDYASFKTYWRLIGWRLLGKAPGLPDMPRARHPGVQPNLI